MEKKNPYVMTIGFNRRDPNHRKVAEFLNGMERGKAQYIVNAVISYQDEERENSIPLWNENSIRRVVEKVLEENRSDIFDERPVQHGNNPKNREERNSQLEEKYVLDIMDSLNAFRKR